jgi:cytochrome c556
MQNRPAEITCLLVSAAFIFACRGPAEWRYEASLEETPKASAHAVHDARLGEVMANLAVLRSERLPKAIDPVEEKARQALEVTRIATAMAESARNIGRAAPADLDALALTEFSLMASQLAQLCEELAAAAPRLSVDELQGRLSAIDDTCTACHVQFRISGLIHDAD